MKVKAGFPTIEHERAAQATVGFFSPWPGIEAVILTGSCARGRASRDSCLDMMVLVPPEVLRSNQPVLAQRWTQYYEAERVFRELERAGQYAEVHLELIDDCFVPRPRDWTSGPDEFELEIGNSLVCSVPLW